MPDYIYYCPECGAERAVTHSIREEPEVLCEVCAAHPSMVRALGGGLFTVKGGRVNSAVDRIQTAREQRQVAEAKDLVRDFGATYRPTMRAAAQGAFGPAPRKPDTDD